MAWVQEEAVTLLEASKNSTTPSFKKALDMLGRIFDAGTTFCNIYEESSSILFKNPVILAIDPASKIIHHVSTEILVEFFEYAPNLWDLVSYRYPRRTCTFENGTSLSRAIKELQRIFLHPDPWFEKRLN